MNSSAAKIDENGVATPNQMIETFNSNSAID